MGPFRFELVKTDGRARLGRMLTGHGPVDTPAFMPVATQGSVKSLAPSDLLAAGAQIVLANTYHLMLRPGHELVRELGGLHRFMGWDGPILTDSGGFQVFSLSKLRRIGEEGVEFRSHVDGSLRTLTPESCVAVQHALGVDVLHPLDECLAHPATAAETERSLGLTERWLDRAIAAHRAAGSPGALFGIVQGGSYEPLRRRAVEAIGALDLPGHSIGGLAVGEPKPVMYAITELVAGLLPADRPRYLMGVGKPPDLVEAVARGVDLFDCVLPTRNARNGQAFTPDGPLNIGNARFARDGSPLDPECPCEGCRRFSRAYLRHLFGARELLAYHALTLHNLTFYLGLMRDMRRAVTEGAFGGFRSRFLARYGVEATTDP
ncbi:MAG TPA: tRNA guanosine(34) transglycosylase Tgt [Methylomirabilota bacterium]|jgi:queuine tRNA-ribosyltransferase|nr:tRNA guanosine(34) transglycosylase Tgt [Methylomirabilota bacterium]